MKTVKFFILSAVLALATGPASAVLMETATFSNVDSVDVAGNAANDTRNYPANAAASYPYILDSISFDGHADAVLSGTFAEELFVRVNHGGDTVDLHLGYPANTTLASTNGNFTGSSGVLGWTVDSGDAFTFEFFESFNDGAGADARWSTIAFDFNGSAAPCTGPNCSVPEPATLALLGLGLVGLGLTRRRVTG